MPVIHDKFVFTHIQKTAGMSLKLMFEDAIPGEVRVTYPHHIRLRDIDEELQHNKFKFTIVRNPFARQYSFYKDDCRNKISNGLKVIDTFEEYFFYRYRDPQFYQEYYLIDYLAFDKIYQTERFDDMIKDLEGKLNIKFKKTFYYGREHVYNRDYSQFYSKNMINILTENEPTLFKDFDYSF